MLPIALLTCKPQHHLLHVNIDKGEDIVIDHQGILRNSGCFVSTTKKMLERWSLTLCECYINGEHIEVNFTPKFFFNDF